MAAQTIMRMGPDLKAKVYHFEKLEEKTPIPLPDMEFYSKNR